MSRVCTSDVWPGDIARHTDMLSVMASPGQAPHCCLSFHLSYPSKNLKDWYHLSLWQQGCQHTPSCRCCLPRPLLSGAEEKSASCLPLAAIPKKAANASPATFLFHGACAFDLIHQAITWTIRGLKPSRLPRRECLEKIAVTLCVQCRNVARCKSHGCPGTESPVQSSMRDHLRPFDRLLTGTSCSSVFQF